MRTRGAALALVAAALALTGGGVAPRAGAEVQGAMISVTPSSVSIGEQIRVDLVGWPQGVATASVCGNAARRGSTDCDQIGGGSIGVGRSGSDTILVDVLAPPVGCPCVVRATTTLGDVVRTAPIEIAGVPGGVDLAPTVGPPDPRALEVTARLDHADVSWPQSWSPLFAGPAQRVLVLHLTNTTDSPITGLRVVGAVGHSKSNEGEPIGRQVALVPPHATRIARVPVLLSAPVYGDYVVKGSIYGTAVPVRFSVKTSSEPWALEIGLPLALLLIAQLLRARDRKRSRDAEAAEAAQVAASSAGLESFPQSSPVVGDRDLGHWESSPYAFPVMETMPTESLDLVELAPATVDEGVDRALVEGRK